MNLKHIKRGDRCLNCGTPLNPEHDNFCSACGQMNNLKKETAVGLIRELVEDFLHLDSKVMHSLVPLVFKPGKLTRDYNSGMRARYFHPVRLFLTVTVIMFLIQGLTSSEEGNGKHENGESKATKSLVVDDGDVRLEDDSIPQQYDKRNMTLDFEGGRHVSYASIDSLVESGITNVDEMMDTLKIKDTWVNRIFMKQTIRIAKSGAESFKEYFKHRLPWILFSLMPVFAFVLWLLYIRKKHYFVDHLIFAFHLHTATFMIISLAWIFEAITNIDSGWFYLYLPVYYFLSLKNVYGQSMGRTLLKGTLGGMLYLFLGGMTFFVVGALAVLLF